MPPSNLLCSMEISPEDCLTCDEIRVWRGTEHLEVEHLGTEGARGKACGKACARSRDCRRSAGQAQCGNQRRVGGSLGPVRKVVQLCGTTRHRLKEVSYWKKYLPN